MNKQQITQEEFDKKVQEAIRDEIPQHYKDFINNDYWLQGTVSNKLKERYEIK